MLLQLQKEMHIHSFDYSEYMDMPSYDSLLYYYICFHVNIKVKRHVLIIMLVIMVYGQLTPYLCDFCISCVLNHILICLQNTIMRIRRLYCNATTISIIVAFLSGWKEDKIAQSVERYLVFSRNHFT